MSSSVAVERTPRLGASLIDAFARRLVHRSFRRLRHGSVVLIDGDRSLAFGRQSDDEPPIVVRAVRPSSYRALAFGGTLGAGRAYVDGEWTTDDLPSLIRLFARNRDALFGLEGGLARIAEPLHRFAHFLRRNTQDGSRRNIAEHYDLGNDFYRLFLDETMAYSCAVFESESQSLKDASLAKFELLARKLQLSPSDHLLEIGTGWGGFAVYAASRFGCRVTTTTISEQQYAFARDRVVRESLTDRVRVVKQDYRELEGRYDKIVSVEMIEAVGHEYYDTFFETCDRLLAPEGVMVLQSITIADQEFERHRREVDFIKRYVFPGSCIPSVTELLRSATQASDLRLLHLEDITHHYVTTIQRWRESFFRKLDAVRAQRFPESFIRMWDFYLGYCEGGFAERYLGDVQLVLVKTGWRPTGRELVGAL